MDIDVDFDSGDDQKKIIRYRWKLDINGLYWFSRSFVSHTTRTVCLWDVRGAVIM